MKVTVEDLSSVKKIIYVEIPEDTVAGELNTAYKEILKTAKIKGFRPGKAPRSVLERMYKKDVHADVSAKLIQESVFAALEEKGLNIVAPPQIDPPALEDKKAYAYQAVVEIYPEIGDIDFKGLSLKKTLYPVTDKEIDLQLKMVQRSLTEQTPVEEDRPVAENDFVLIDYEGFKDGKPFQETQKTQNFTMKIGDKAISGQLDDQIIGMKKGEEKDIVVLFPPDYFNPKLAGQTISFHVTLNQIRKEVVPEINDELAKKVGAYQTLEELKDVIRQNMQKGYDQRAEQEINEQIFTHLIGKTEFEVPAAMTDMELEGILEDTERSLNYRNMSMQDLGMTRESLSEKYRDTAEKQVRRHLILNKIIDQEKLEVPEEELDKNLAEMAETVGQSVDQIKEYYEKNSEKMSFLKHTLLEKQALKLIMIHSTVEEVEPELEKEPGSETDQAAE
jgi:trigger factor